MEGKTLINPWREARGMGAWDSEIQPIDVDDRIFGERVEKGIPQVLFVEPSPALAPVEPSPRDKVIALIGATLARRWPHITFAVVMGTVKRRRNDVYKYAPLARRDCIRAVKAAFPSYSTTHIGRIFGIHHTTVIHALSDERIARKKAIYRAKVAA